MHPADIKAALEKAGTKQSEIARMLSVSPQTVSLVLRGHGTSGRVARRIGLVIGRSPAEIWPGKYRDIHKEAA